MRVAFALFATVSLLATPPAAGFPQDADEDNEWPHEILTNTHKLILYQPQLDSLEGDTIVAVAWKHWDREVPKLIQALSRFRDDAV